LTYNIQGVHRRRMRTWLRPWWRPQFSIFPLLLRARCVFLQAPDRAPRTGPRRQPRKRISWPTKVSSHFVLDRDASRDARLSVCPTEMSWRRHCLPSSPMLEATSNHTRPKTVQLASLGQCAPANCGSNMATALRNAGRLAAIPSAN
jgi:hypothetical protein